MSITVPYLKKNKINVYEHTLSAPLLILELSFPLMITKVTEIQSPSYFSVILCNWKKKSHIIL